MSQERVYLECPDCGNGFPKPFYRGQIHNRACNPCRRFVVSVDPCGDDHWFIPVGEEESYEAATDRIVSDHRERVERAMFLRLAMERAG